MHHTSEPFHELAVRCTVQVAVQVALYAQQRLQQVVGQLPTPRGEVERVLVAQWPIELRAQRMEHNVHLVDHGNASPPGLQQLHRPRRLRSQRREVQTGLEPRRLLAHQAQRTADALHSALHGGVAARVLAGVDEMQELQELQHEGLEGCGGAQEHSVLRSRRPRLRDELRGHRRASVECKRPCGLAQCAATREARAQHVQRKREELGRHDLDDERGISEQQREKRRDHRRLPLAHEHLMAHRAARLRSCDQLGHEVDLLRPEHEPGAELEVEEARVINVQAVVAIGGDMWPAHRKDGRQLIGDHVALAAACLSELADQLSGQRQAARGVGGAIDQQEDGGGSLQQIVRVRLGQQGVEVPQRLLTVGAHQELSQELHRDGGLRPRRRGESADEPLHVSGGAATEGGLVQQMWDVGFDRL